MRHALLVSAPVTCRRRRRRLGRLYRPHKQRCCQDCCRDCCRRGVVYTFFHRMAVLVIDTHLPASCPGQQCLRLLEPPWRGAGNSCRHKCRRGGRHGGLSSGTAETWQRRWGCWRGEPGCSHRCHRCRHQALDLLHPLRSPPPQQQQQQQQPSEQHLMNAASPLVSSTALSKVAQGRRRRRRQRRRQRHRRGLLRGPPFSTK